MPEIMDCYFSNFKSHNVLANDENKWLCKPLHFATSFISVGLDMCFRLSLARKADTESSKRTVDSNQQPATGSHEPASEGGNLPGDKLLTAKDGNIGVPPVLHVKSTASSKIKPTNDGRQSRKVDKDKILASYKPAEKSDDRPLIGQKKPSEPKEITGSKMVDGESADVKSLGELRAEAQKEHPPTKVVYSLDELPEGHRVGLSTTLVQPIIALDLCKYLSLTNQRARFM